MDQHERIRLLYVACTRARDHLGGVGPPRRSRQVGPAAVHRRAAPRSVRGPAEQQAALTGSQVLLPADTEGPAPPPAGAATAPPPPVVTDLAAWRAARAELIATARLPRSISATRLAAEALGPVGAADVPVDVAVDVMVGGRSTATMTGSRSWPARRRPTTSSRAWPSARSTSTCRRGAGAATAPRSAGPSTASSRWSISPPATVSRPWPRAQAAAEGIDDEWERIAGLARSALAAPCVAEAASPAPLAGGVRRGALRRHRAGGLHRPAVPPSRRPGRRGPQDGSHRDDRRRRAPPAGEAGRLPPPARGLRGRRGTGHGRARSSPRSSCSARRRAGRRRSSPISAPPWTRCRACWIRGCHRRRRTPAGCSTRTATSVPEPPV